MVQPVHLAPSSQSSMSFTFTKPAASYGKTAPGIAFSGAGGGVAPWFSADVDNGDGTMTGTINFGAPITGTVDFLIYDRQ